MSDRTTADSTGRTSTDAPNRQTTVDPTGFSRDYSPSVIRFEDSDPITCAHHRVNDSYVWLKTWDGRRLKIPLRRIEEIEVILTRRTTDNDGHEQKQLINDPEAYL